MCRIPWVSLAPAVLRSTHGCNPTVANATAQSADWAFGSRQSSRFSGGGNIAVGEIAPAGRAKPTVDVTFMFPSPVGATENVGDSATPTGLAFFNSCTVGELAPTAPRSPTASTFRRQGGLIVGAVAPLHGLVGRQGTQGVTRPSRPCHTNRPRAGRAWKPLVQLKLDTSRISIRSGIYICRRRGRWRGGPVEASLDAVRPRPSWSLRGI